MSCVSVWVRLLLPAWWVQVLASSIFICLWAWVPSGRSNSFSCSKEISLLYVMDVSGWATICKQIKDIFILFSLFWVFADPALFQSLPSVFWGHKDIRGNLQQQSWWGLSRAASTEMKKTKSKHDRNSIISLPGSVCCLSANDVGSRWPDPLPLVSKAIFPSLKCKLSCCF